jgi:nicotinate-nucleotide adenylyltransferase
MVRLAIDDNPLLALSRADLDRPPPSYSVDLLRSLRRQYEAETDFFMLVGADVLDELPLWHQPLAILSLATLVVATRPGAPDPDPVALEARLPGVTRRVQVLTIPGVAISSTELRARAAAGRSLRYLTPPAVETYIRERGLYCTGTNKRQP